MDQHLTRVRARLAFALLILSVGVVLSALQSTIAGLLRDEFRGFLAIVTVSTFLYGIALLLLLYLRGDIAIAAIDRFIPDRGLAGGGDSSNPPVYADAIEDLRLTVSKLKQQLSIIQSRTSNDHGEDLATAVANLRRELIPELAVDLQQHYANLLEPAARNRLVRDNLARAQSRLQSEIEALSRRSNVNLVIGTLTTTFAIGLLVYMVAAQTAAFADLTALLAYYIPRVTTAIFIQVFAFFFLKLYKANLGEIQYYQNELTNLTLVDVSLERAHGAPPEAQSRLMEILISSDRNYRLRDGRLGTDERTSADVTELLRQLTSLVSVTTSAK